MANERERKKRRNEDSIGDYQHAKKAREHNISNSFVTEVS